MPHPLFCDREVVRSFIEGKSVALVGSGPGCLDNPPGFVDSHDVVVRVNAYKTGPGPGYRTDIYYSFFGTSIRKPSHELIADGVKLCICKCPDAQFIESTWHRRHGKMAGVDFRYIYKARKGWWFCPTYVPTVDEFMRHFRLLGDHVPTTGFAALLTILEHNPRNLFVTGFDFFQSGVHNVDERWRSGDPADPIGHSPDGEREWFAANVERLPVTMDAMLSDALAKNVTPRHAPIPHHRRKVLRRKFA